MSVTYMGEMIHSYKCFSRRTQMEKTYFMQMIQLLRDRIQANTI